MYKLFPCINNEKSNSNEPSQQDIQLQKERQKILEELLNSDLEQQRLENEKMAREEFENILKEAEQLTLKEAEQRTLKEAEQRTLKEAEQRTLKEAEQRTLKEAEQRTLKEAEQRTLKEAEERTLKEAEQRTLKEAEERTLKEAEQRTLKEAEQRVAEELRKLEDVQITEEQNLLEQEKADNVNGDNIKNITHVVFTTYKENYHEFYSTRQQPIRSNFNEKMFKDLCNKFAFSTEEELLTSLNDYNHMRKNNKKSYNELSTTRRVKCDVLNFYLFI
jgi:hypothetical protein